METASLTAPRPLPVQPAAARRKLSQLLADARWGGDADAVVLAVHEAMVNAQRHAGGVTRATAGLEGDAVVVEVADGGTGFRIPDVPDMPDASAETGRGLYLIRRLAADARVVRSGKEVRFVLRFER